MPSRGEKLDSRYWDRVVGQQQNAPRYLYPFLGELERRAYLTLIRRWGGVPDKGRILKTDLFEEATGPGTFFSELMTTEANVVGMDLSPAVAWRAKQRFSTQRTIFINTDARCLPFPNQRFTLVVSHSTLDHFVDPLDLGRSLRELARVLEPGGRLIIALDNRQNVGDPLLRLAKRLGFVPYFLGRSYTVRELRRELEAAGLVVEETTAILHNPRLVAVAAVAGAKWLGWAPLSKLVQRILVAAQRLEATRWRYFTGSFVAAKAIRPSS
jgi:SAM-dependent methyltransferase